MHRECYVSVLPVYNDFNNLVVLDRNDSKRFSVFFLAVLCLLRFKVCKSAKYEQKIFSSKFKMGIKQPEFDAYLESVEKVA